MKYNPALDGFRAIAVLLVIFRHWHFPNLQLECGWVGVNFFFVLSGFLISTIILSDKEKLAFKPFIKFFYLKRTLRIFPVYYLYLIVAALVLLAANALWDEKPLLQAQEHFSQNWRYLFTYTYNFNHLSDLMTGTGTEGSKMFNHLWSLSVEEQFYLVFPFAAYFLSRKNLRVAALIIIVIGPVVRLVTTHYLLGHFQQPFLSGLIVYKSTFTQIDSFAAGIFLSTINFSAFNFSGKKAIIALMSILLLLVAATFFFRSQGVAMSWKSLSLEMSSDQFVYHNRLVNYWPVFSYSIINLFAAILILSCMKGLRLVRFFENKFLVGIGRMSYGVYLFHNGLFVFFSILVMHYAGKEALEHSFLLELCLFIIYLSVVLGVSWLSFRFFEKPILNLKDKLKKRLGEHAAK